MKKQQQDTAEMMQQAAELLQQSEELLKRLWKFTDELRRLVKPPKPRGG